MPEAAPLPTPAQAPNAAATACALCGGSDHRLVLRGARDRLARKQGVFDLAACERCGLIATLPLPSPAELAYYYDGVYTGPAVRYVQSGPPAHAAARYRLRTLRRLLPWTAATRLLDVGCSYGAFPAEAVQATGCTATGIDMDAGSLADALARDRVSYLEGTVQSVDLPAASFDLVTLFHSLEHHTDPVAALRAAHRLLAPGGHCVVEVPNFLSLWRPVFRTWWLPLLVPQHLFHFTPATLRRAMTQAGFEVRAPHRAMYFPTESTVSLGLWLNDLLGRPLRRFRPRWTRPDGWLLLALLPLWWLLVEVPSQAVLVALGRSGAQLMVGRKPVE